MSKETNQDNLSQRAAELRTSLLGKEPRDLASYTATLFDDAGEGSGEFRFPLWGREVILTYPALQVMDAHSKKDLSVFDQTMVLYYFSTCDGTPMAASWIAFSELPDGRFYNQAFQGYTGREVAKARKRLGRLRASGPQCRRGKEIPDGGSTAWRRCFCLPGPSACDAIGGLLAR